MITNNIEPIKVKTEDGWIIVVQYAPWSDRVELWIGKEEHGKFYRATIVGGGIIELAETTEGEEKVSPTLTVNSSAWQGLSTALRGVTPQVDKKEVDAELKATKFHLEDMRTLVLGNRK